MKPIRAIYENGVFKPTEQVDLPENCPVCLEFKPDHQDDIWDAIYTIMSGRYRTGECDPAAREEEPHQNS